MPILKKRATAIHPSHDLLRSTSQPLDIFFRPQSVAMVGASDREGSVGRTILHNLLATPFGGTVYPVNAKRSSVLGVKAYPSIAKLPETADLAVIATPAATVPDVLKECADCGVPGAVVISAGFKEVGAEGVELERRCLEIARGARMRLIGPNCLGVMNPIVGFNATFAGAIARPGNVGFISQSGALCTAVLDWSLRENLGFSAFLSIGSMLDVNWGDLIYHLGDDPNTKSIVIYMESVGDARAFCSAAREVALAKPIIIIKPGRTEAAARAAASHTGGLAGSDAVLQAAFRRCGVLRVDTLEDLFFMAEAVGKQPLPAGPRLTILTNAGGPAVLATDALTGDGGQLAPLDEKLRKTLDGFLPPQWSRANPIDILGDAGPDRYTKALEALAGNPDSDGTLVILSPQGMTDPAQIANEVVRYAKQSTKPVLACWMGGGQVAEGEAILNKAAIPTYPFPDGAAKMFNHLWRYSYNLRGLYETPALATEADHLGAAHARAAKRIAKARGAGRTILTEHESKALLADYGLPVTKTIVAASAAEAAHAAQRIGYPVVVKLHSHTLTHKTDVKGVRLNLGSAKEVRAAFEEMRKAVAKKAGREHFNGVTVQPMVRAEGYELILGCSLDPQFGPVLLFGAGGTLVEVFRDRALGLPPLNTTLARRMIEQTRIAAALKGVRGRKPVDAAALEQLLVRFSQLVVGHPEIKEIDINPLLAGAEQLLVLDARVVLHEAKTDLSALPKPAIRPYPAQYVKTIKARDGQRLTLRPIRPEDEPLMVAFHGTLSERSVYLRYLGALKLDRRIEHQRLARLCFIDYDREMALVAVREKTRKKERAIVGVVRLSAVYGTGESEFAMLIADEYQRQGLGTQMLQSVLDVGRAEGVKTVTATIMSENAGMQQVCRKLGFALRTDPDDAQIVNARIDLAKAAGGK